jgi:aryl-alcohol dehydrogenase-like predicted oxidoreductase
MSLPPESQFQFTPDLTICRILNGMWQVSGGHGKINPRAAVEDMFLHHEAGFTTWDLADHYGPAEDFIGEFKRELIKREGEAEWAKVQAFTKWVPRPLPITRQVVEEAIDLSRQRMGEPTLDLLQFHWWDYSVPGYLAALKHMADLRDEGKIRHLGLTNFDTERTTEIVKSGVRVVSNQVQYSLIDRRPEKRMVPFCQENEITLLTYGTLCGGLISEKFINKSEPSSLALNTPSLQKYKQILDMWGGWKLFQTLLQTLLDIAHKHKVTIANVAVRYILDRPAVAGVITGVRLGLMDHIEENVRVFNLSLDDEDSAAIEDVLLRGNDLILLIGDCGDEYRH